MEYGPCQFKGWYTHKNSAQYQWYHWTSTDWYQQHIHNNNMDVLVAIYQYNINTEPAKQKQVTGQIRTGTPELNSTRLKPQVSTICRENQQPEQR